MDKESCNQKDWHEKEKAQNDTWSLQSQTTTLLNVESSPKYGFESELYLGMPLHAPNYTV